jgi:hypothetical protein
LQPFHGFGFPGIIQQSGDELVVLSLHWCQRGYTNSNTFGRSAFHLGLAVARTTTAFIGQGPGLRLAAGPDSSNPYWNLISAMFSLLNKPFLSEAGNENELVFLYNSALEMQDFSIHCVYVNTIFSPRLVTVASSDEGRNESDRPAGQEMAHEEGLVAGSPGRKTPIARLERQPRFLGQSRIAAAPCSRLRAAFSRPCPGS